MCTSSPLSTKLPDIGSTGPLNSENQAPRPLDENITSHRHKWTFLEAAKYVMSHGLKRSAGRMANPRFHGLRRSRSQDIKTKPIPKPPSRIGAHSYQGVGSQSGASQLCRDPSIAGPAVAIQLDGTDTGWVPTTHLLTDEEVNTWPNDCCQIKEFILSPDESALKTSHGPMHANPGTQLSSAYRETRVVNDTAISRRMNASEVVSQLIKHGIKDLSERLNQSTFEDHPLVTGGFSDVYRGQLTSGAEVAVKVLRISVQRFSETSENIQDAAREIHTWSKCKHPNVLPLYGLVTFRSRIGMVSPWMSGGTMPRYLKANPEADRQTLCIQMCEGLTYLHEYGIIHGDLKGANVLIAEDGTPVLTDFGNSSLKDRTLKFTQAPGDDALTVRWSAPEFIRDSGISLRTKASDVYALGMTIYEAIVGKVPYYGETEVQVIIMVALKQVPPERPIWMPMGHENGDRLWDLLSHCWSWDPETRPSVIQVTETIRKIRIEGLLIDPPNHVLQSQGQ
ncbi:tyrosine kinase catalytic domain protein [Rhizoctonia solani AG-3 Rhs1AP]|uniref:Tyrosine kinase catalytic domain protein n=1 Tax=Rhizoctonia solani AG-3 Rhs1AP TaxID=1086054 RepID=X8JA99_9AGAM|nr:tyrosine kinase catalytic domain protein [Rhizoctonia solani AG-3 Rhs1AP]